MFFSGFSYQHQHQQQPGGAVDDAAAPYDGDRDHNHTVLLTFGIFFSFVLLYLVAGLIWASVVTACAVALSFCYLKARARRRAAAAAALRAAAGSRGGPQAIAAAVALSAIPAFAYKREGAGGGDATGWAQCVICLGLVQVGEVVRRLPACKHLFHVECIDAWLRSHTTCPICRAAVEPTDGQPEPEPPV